MKKDWKIFTSLFVVTMIIVCLGCLVGCDNKDKKQYVVVDIINPMSKTPLKEKVVAEFDSTKFSGFDFKYKFKDKKNYLSNDDVDLSELESFTYIWLEDENGKTYDLEVVDWPTEKGIYNMHVSFNEIYWNCDTGIWRDPSPKYYNLSWHYTYKLI